MSQNPMDLLREEMDNDDVYVRINAIHRLKIIATLLGTEGVKNQLLPYLDQLIKSEDDEVIFAIAEELGNLGQFLPNQQTLILPNLENLAQYEETVVRDTACKSLIQISQLLSDQEIINSYIPLIMRLASDGDNFTSRVSAINILTQIYPRAQDKKYNLRQKFFDLFNEDTPMVRRALAIKIGEFATLIEKQFVIADLIGQFKNLTSDEQDQVRVLCLNSLRIIAGVLTKEENITHTLPILIAAIQDKSWRVRLQVAVNFYDISNAFGKEIFDQHIIQTFMNLLKDPEYEVKIAAIESLSKVIDIMKTDKYATITPIIQTLCQDNNKQVKAGVAHVISNLFTQVKKDPQLSKLLPNIIDFFGHENLDVRIGGIKAAVKYIQVYGQEALNALLPHLKNSIADQKWRVRSESLNALVDIAVTFDNYDLFVKQLEPLIIIYLKDKNCALRDEGVSRIKDLVKTYKSDWVNQSLLNKLNECLAKDQSYLIKISAFYSLQQVASALPNDYVNDKIVPIFLKNIKDSVPNIRFVICKILQSLNKQLNSNTIKQALQELSNDIDKDVKIYSQQL